MTGDHAGHAEAVAREVGITEVHASLMPEDKVAVVAGLEAAGHRVLMLGDGTNDAPALSRASVGVALAAHGGMHTAEAAEALWCWPSDPSRCWAGAIVISYGRCGWPKSIWVTLAFPVWPWGSRRSGSSRRPRGPSCRSSSTWR
ncbi:MAG: HAD-IC family P-type ATPase [Gemmatimonadetes bacterium]|nr:HAD-IC family P-type ATPase [Gemmatimonadota bacterium]